MRKKIKQNALRFVDKYTPKQLIDSPDRLDQEELFIARVIVSFSIALTAMVFLVFILRLILEGSNSRGVWLLFASSLFLASQPHIMKRFQSTLFAKISFMALGLFIIPIRTWFTGGIDSSVAAWFVLIPVVGWLTLRKKMRLIVVALSLLELTFIAFPNTFGLPSPTFESNNEVQFAVLVVLMLLLTALVWLYHEERTAQLILLEDRASQITALSGLLRICAVCKKIHDADEGVWKQLESYIDTHSEAQFSHGYCPSCFDKQCREEGLD